MVAPTPSWEQREPYRRSTATQRHAGRRNWRLLQLRGAIGNLRILVVEIGASAWMLPVLRRIEKLLAARIEELYRPASDQHHVNCITSTTPERQQQ